jgi:tRNA G18 (ribose-2'-O)-methylase SpoU
MIARVRPPHLVEDPDDPLVADYVGLTDAELRRRVEAPGGRAPEGIFVAEGVLAIRRLLRSGYRTRSVLLAPNRLDALREELDAHDEVAVLVAAREVLEAVAGYDVHRGALAVGERRALPPLAETVSGARGLVVLEAVSDTENLGALFRNAAAFGLDAVVLDPRSADPLYRRSVRVSLGHALHIPFTRLASWPKDLERLTALGFRLVALDPGGEVPLERLREHLGADEPLALLVGNEGHGLSAEARRACDTSCRVPMPGDTDSLNVATAFAVAAYELFARGR